MTQEAPRPSDDQANVVMRNVADLAQRHQQRELGASLALQIFRLLKVVQFHAIDNMAVLQQLDQTIESLKAFGAQTGEPLVMLFAGGTIFVAGQLFKASRGEYENALELGEMVRKLGVSEITIQTDATRPDLTALARVFQPGANPLIDKEGVIEPSPRVRLRYVNPARLGEGEENLSEEEQIVRTYATSVVVMRRVHENLAAGRYELPHQAKRLAQRLVMLSQGDTPAFLGITAMRTLNHDNAGRAVNRAILAVAMARQLTEDLGALARIAMSALFLDVAHPLVTGIVGRQDDVLVPHMTEDAAQRLPAATSLVLTALGQLRPASMVRTVIAYETHWLAQQDALGPLYGGVRKAMVAARIVLTAHKFNSLLEPDLAASRTPSVDEVVEQMRADAQDATERAMLALLVGALGIFPRGTAVELTTGEKGVVVRTPGDPSLYTRPTVRLVCDAHGQPLRTRVAIDLSQDDERQVGGVIAQPDGLLAEACRLVLEATRTSAAPPPPSAPPPSSESPNVIPTVPPEPVPAPEEPQAMLVDEEPQAMLVDEEPQAMLVDEEPEGVQEAAPEPAVEEPEPPPPPPVPVLPPVSGKRRAQPAPVAIPALTRTPTENNEISSVSSESHVSAPSSSMRAPPSVGPPRSARPSRAPPPMGPPVRSEPVPDETPSQARRSRQKPPLPPRARPAGGVKLADLPVDPEQDMEPSAPSAHWRRPPPSVPDSDSRASGPTAMEQAHAPSASGSFERTPFSHILLYLLDRSLSGTLIFTEPADRAEDLPTEHAAYFADGVPTKVHVGTRVAPLGPMLVAWGILDQAQLETEPITQPPTHEATLETELLELGFATADQLVEIRSGQLLERLSYLFGLPQATKYAFYNGLDLLEAIWGNVPGRVSTHAVLARGLRERPEEAAMDRVLTRVAGAPLRMHADADLDVFQLEPDERVVADAIATREASLPDLIEAGYDPDVIRRVVFLLMMARCAAPVSE